MEVTEVRIFPIDDKKVKAYATITFDDCFVVRDIKVIDGINGLFVAMPSKRTKDGTFKDTVHPVKNEIRLIIESRILEAYRKETENGASIAV